MPASRAGKPSRGKLPPEPGFKRRTRQVEQQRHQQSAQEKRRGGAKGLEDRPADQRRDGVGRAQKSRRDAQHAADLDYDPPAW